MNRKHWPYALGVVCLLALSAPALAEDAVFGAKGVPVRGDIVGTSPTEITIERAGAKQTIPVNEVRKVTLTDEPNELEKAREFIRSGNFNGAVDELKKIKPDPSMRPIVKQDVEYYTAFAVAKQALEGSGDKRSAGALLKTFIDNNGGSFHYFEACETFGDLAVSVGGFEAGAKYYALLANAPWPDYKMKSYIYEGRALLATEKYAEALQKYEAVIGSEVNTPEARAQKQMATVGKAVCLANTGKGEDGLKLLDEIIQNGDPNTDKVLFSRVYNAQGACHLKAGRNKDALLAYLHTHLLYPNDSETHAEALYNLVKLWTDAGKQDRSVAVRKLLTDKYPGSRWATLK
jgi:tetratricopeptide (TPR) repeat protein